MVPDVVDYVKVGIALGVYNANDLEKTILDLLNDDSKLRKNRRKYMKSTIYRNDGKASDRVASLIKCIILENMKKHPN